MKTQSPELRLARLADAEQIACMSREFIEVGLGWSWTVQRVTRAIQCPDTTVLAAKAGPTVQGFAIMRFGQDEAHLNLLAVAPNDRRRKLGRHLMQWLEESCRVAGSFVIYLEVRATNHGARCFYQRLGYREIACVPRYYQGVETAIRMARDLTVE
ncbi:MAG: GNAT family N-acetyltransferase [Gammaproteobacteria bacterium]